MTDELSRHDLSTHFDLDEPPSDNENFYALVDSKGVTYVDGSRGWKYKE